VIISLLSDDIMEKNMANPSGLRGAALTSMKLAHLVDEERYGKLIYRNIRSLKMYDNDIIKKNMV